MSKKVWVAKCSESLGKLHDFELSPRFESIYDCQNYIDTILGDIQINLNFAVTNILLMNGKIGFGNCIRCFNIEQNRWCDGFDF